MMVARKDSRGNLQEKQTTAQITQKAGSPRKHLEYLPYRLEACAKLHQMANQYKTRTKHYICSLTQINPHHRVGIV